MNRVKILTGINKGKLATAVSDLPNSRTLVYLDGASSYEGWRSYSNGSLKEVSDVVIPPPVEPSPVGGTLVLDEQFAGAALDTTKWSPYTSPGNHSPWPGLRLPSALAVVNGRLVISATYDPEKKIIASGAMSHNFDWSYGTVEVKARTDYDPTGQMSGVILRWPMRVGDDWGSPGDGELDFYETGTSLDRKLKSFFHYSGTRNLQKDFDHGVSATDWHVIKMECTPEAIRLYRNGVLVYTITDSFVLSTLARKGHVCIQLDTFGKNGYVPLVAPVKMEVEYVKVWTP